MLCLMKHELVMTVIEYYTKFRSLLDGLGELQTLPEYTCGTSKEIMQREGDQQVHIFLGSHKNERFEYIFCLLCIQLKYIMPFMHLTKMDK